MGPLPLLVAVGHPGRVRGGAQRVLRVRRGHGQVGGLPQGVPHQPAGHRRRGGGDARGARLDLRRLAKGTLTD